MQNPPPDARVSPHWYEWLRLIAPILVGAALVIAIAWPFLEPAPPKRVVIATGPEGSTYNDYAAAYAEYFAQQGILLVARSTGGASENYQLLLDPNSGVDLAIVQGGTAPPPDQTESLEAVCSVSFEPLFVLYRNEAFPNGLTRLEQLAGKRIAIGSTSGGTRRVALPLLALHGLTPPNADTPTSAPSTQATQYVDQSGTNSARLLRSGQIDAGFYAVDANTPYIADLLATRGIRIMDFANADAYASRLEYLSVVTLHPGIIGIQRNIPDRDVKLVAPVTAIVAKKSTHQAIIQLAVQAAQRVHGHHHPLAAPGTFPSLNYTELPISEGARYFFNTRPSFLQRKLPFWLASMIDRLLILFIPLLVVLIPLIRFAPAIYRWQVRSRIYRWYKRLRILDARLLALSTPAQRALDRQEAEDLEHEISMQKVPLSHMEQLYNVRLHLAYLRERLSDQSLPHSSSAAGTSREDDVHNH